MAEPIPSDLHISVCLKVDNDNGSMTCMPVVLAMKQHPEETHRALIAAIREISSSPDSPKAFSLDLLDELLVHLDKDHHIPHHVLNKARYTMETYRDNARIVRQAAAANKKRKANNSATDFKFVNMGVRSSIPKPPPKPQTGQQKPWQASKYQEHVPSPVESTYRSVYSEAQQSASPASGAEQNDHLRHDQFARRDSYGGFYPGTQQSASPSSVAEQNTHLRLDQRPQGEPYGMGYPETQQSRSPASAPDQSEHFRHDQFARRDSYRSVYADTRQSVSPLSAPGQSNHSQPNQLAQPPQNPEQTPSAEPYRTVYPKPPILPSSAPEQTSNLRPEQLSHGPRYHEQAPSPADSYTIIRPVLQPSSSPIPAPVQNNNSQPEQIPQTSRFHLNPFKAVHQEPQQSTSPAPTPASEQNEASRNEQLARAALSMSQGLDNTPSATETASNSQQSEYRSRDNNQPTSTSDPSPPPLPPVSPMKAYQLKLEELERLRAQLRDGDAMVHSQSRPFEPLGSQHSEAKQVERQEKVVQCLNELNSLRAKLPPDSVPEPAALMNPPPHTPTNQTFSFAPIASNPSLPPPPSQSQPQSQTLPNVNSILNSTASEIKTLPPYLSIYGPAAPSTQRPNPPPTVEGQGGDVAKQQELAGS